jgi:phosphonate degradation associated HDIG domain protein
MKLDGAGVVDRLFDLFASRGPARYDEDVTQLEHALQAAALARRERAAPELIVAALLHDVGHLLLAQKGEQVGGEVDLRHERVGARFLAQWLPTAVTGPVALHVAAKRFLVAIDPAYADRLSEASRRSLSRQGGPMDAGGIAVFRARPWAHAAVWLRKLDDGAKVIDRAVPPLDDFRDLIRGLVDQCAIARKGAL